MGASSVLNANSFGTVTLGAFAASNGQTFNVSAGGTLGGNSFSTTGAPVNVNGGLFDFTTFNLNVGATTLSNGGEIRAAAINFGGGTLNWSLGTVHYIGHVTVEGSLANSLLGPSLAITADRTLRVGGTATISAPLNLNGIVLSFRSTPSADWATLDSNNPRRSRVISIFRIPALQNALQKILNCNTSSPSGSNLIRTKRIESTKS